MLTQEEQKRDARMCLLPGALEQVELAVGAELMRQELCTIKSPSKCLVLSFTRLKILPEIMLAALRLPPYFKFDTSKLGDGNTVLYNMLLKLTGNDK